MSQSSRPVAVMYNVGDLKAAFQAVKDKEFALGGADQTNPTGQPQCAYRNADAVLAILNRFDNQDFVALPAKPSELSLPTDEPSQSFLRYHKAGQCVGIPTALANHLRGIGYDY